MIEADEEIKEAIEQEDTESDDSIVEQEELDAIGNVGDFRMTIDSGASSCFCSKKECFSNLRPTTSLR